MKEKVLQRMNKIVAALLLLIGVVALTAALRDLKFGSFAKPQAGFAPIIFSIGLIIFSAINLVIELFRKNSIPENLKHVDWKKWILYMSICIAYVFFIKKIGFTVDTFLCLLMMLKLTGQRGILKPLIISAVFSVILWALFTYAMNVALPAADWF